jgi:hypothetical protein
MRFSLQRFKAAVRVDQRFRIDLSSLAIGLQSVAAVSEPTANVNAIVSFGGFLLSRSLHSSSRLLTWLGANVRSCDWVYTESSFRPRSWLPNCHPLLQL